MEEDIGYLERIELSLAFAVARLQQLLIEGVATGNPAHQVGTCHFWSGIWEIEQC